MREKSMYEIDRFPSHYLNQGCQFLVDLPEPIRRKLCGIGHPISSKWLVCFPFQFPGAGDAGEGVCSTARVMPPIARLLSRLL